MLGEIARHSKARCRCRSFLLFAMQRFFLQPYLRGYQGPACWKWTAVSQSLITEHTIVATPVFHYLHIAALHNRSSIYKFMHTYRPFIWLALLVQYFYTNNNFWKSDGSWWGIVDQCLCFVSSLSLLCWPPAMLDLAGEVYSKGVSRTAIMYAITPGRTSSDVGMIYSNRERGKDTVIGS